MLAPHRPLEFTGVETDKPARRASVASTARSWEAVMRTCLAPDRDPERPEEVNVDPRAGSANLTGVLGRDRDLTRAGPATTSTRSTVSVVYAPDMDMVAGPER